MSFRPKVGQCITFNSINYNFTEHPSALKMVYGQTGRRATVYQVQDGAGGLHALKVFTSAWRDPRNAESARQLFIFTRLPGLRVCGRYVFTPKRDTELISAYPDLEFAVLMPWVSGKTWQEVILNKHPFSVEQSQVVGRLFVEILMSMEDKGLAHCDLSGPNVLIDFTPLKVELVDVEDLFGPGLERPQKVGGGSSGYAHKTAPVGLWNGNADRFAGSVLLAEMLGWCDERVRRIAYGEQYFDPGEVQQGSERYQVLLDVLKERWGTGVADAFAQVWFSETLEECLTFTEWQHLINMTENQRLAQKKINSGQKFLELGQMDQALAELDQAYHLDPETAIQTYLQVLMVRGNQRFDAGELDLALKDFQAAITLMPEGKDKHEVELAINNVNQAIFDQKFKGIEDLLEKGQVEEAVSASECLYQAVPISSSEIYARSLLARGNHKENQGNLTGAQQDYKKGFSIAAEGKLKNDLYISANQLEDQIIKKEIDNTEALLMNDQYDEAIQEIEKIYQAHPEATGGVFARALYSRGTMRERKKDLHEALSDYRQALQVAQESSLKDEIRISLEELQASLDIIRRDDGSGILIGGEDHEPKKKKKLSGCLILFFILLAISVTIFGLWIIGWFLGTIPTNEPVNVETIATLTRQPSQELTTSAPTSVSLEVDASKGWTNTGITISEGDLLEIRYLSGLWSPWPGGNFDANGDPTSDINWGDNVVESCHHGKLIGRVGMETLCIGNNYSEIAAVNGTLYLSINDKVTYDNSGAINLSITITSGTGITDSSGLLSGSFSTPTKTKTKVAPTVTQTKTPTLTCSSSENCFEVEVSARTMWQSTKINVSKGDRVLIEYISGEWKVGSDNTFPWNDGSGYDGIRPIDMCSFCTAPIYEGTLGQLVAKIAETRPVYAISKKGEFNSDSDGLLCLMINDLYESFQDNTGSLKVRIRVNP